MVNATYKAFGEDNFMWASHGASIWPKSREVVASIFADVPSEVNQKIIYDNAANRHNWSPEKRGE